MKRHGINARNATERLSTPGKNVFVAVAKQSPSENSLRYLAGIVIGCLVTFFLVAPPTIVQNADSQFAVIMKYRQMIERDDRAISQLLGVERWDRNKQIYGRSYLLSNGGEVLAFTQTPRSDRAYELSF
jgi:hypothetical protein